MIDRESRGVLRALAALGALAAVVVGVPIVLVRLGHALPLDLGALAPGAWAHADDGRLLLLVILAVAWAAWAAMALSVAVESWSALRRVRTPALPGLATPQRMAAVLVAAVVVALSPTAGSGGTAVAAPASTAVSDEAAWQPSSAEAVRAAGAVAAAAPADEVAAGPHDAQMRRLAPGPGAGLPAIDLTRDDVARSRVGPPTVTTQRHDTLWMLAETYLGAGERFVEIVDLNRDVTQPDGHTLGDGGRVYPGWTLVMPADADLSADRPELHVVVPGDTLWDIAGDELGDPTHYPEIADANRGDLQPDGRHLSDPGLILPGWILEIPGTGSADVPQVASDEQAPPAHLPPIDRSSGDRSAVAGAHPPGVVPPLDRGVAEPMPAVASPHSSPPAAAAASAQSDDPGRADRSAGGFALRAGGSASALLLAGVAAELARRRRQFQRHRRPGERMPIPTSAAQRIERAARTAAHEPGLDLLDRALTALAENAARSGVAVPDVRIVRVTGDTVTLDLATPASDPIAPFMAASGKPGTQASVDAATRWVLDPALLPAGPIPAGSLPAGSITAEQPRDEHAGRHRALPGLVTLGFSGDQTVLLNLESVGTLAVTGEGEVLGDVLRGFAAELALGPTSALSERLLCLADASIEAAVEAGSIGIEHDPARACAAIRDAIRPAAGPATEADPLLIVLSDQALDVRVMPSSGSALISAAPMVAAGATLAVHAAGAAVLLPEGERIVPQTLSRRATRDIVDVLSATDLPDSAPSDPVAPAAAPKVIDLREATREAAGNSSVKWIQGILPVGEPDVDGQGATDREGDGEAEAHAHRGSLGSVDRPRVEGGMAPRVLVLGEIQVENAGGRSESSRIGRLAETAAFVLMNPGSRQSELQGALWPGRRSNPQTCRQMISRARTWLGRTAAGEPYLMNFADTGSRLRLRDEVTSDWADFQRLAANGLASPGDTEQLTEALSLVRGRPFGAVASRELPWADLHINEMISLITDVAYALAVRHEEAGSPSAACAAALRGLQTDSDSAVLEEIVARTAR